MKTFSQKRSIKMDSRYSDGSDIDSTVTPIEMVEEAAHGQVVESDTLSDPIKHEDRHRHKLKKPHRKFNNKHRARDMLLRSPDREESPELSRRNLKEIYKELELISDKLKEENRLLHQRECEVKERERMVSISQENLKTIADHEVKQRLQPIEERYRQEMDRLEQALKEKSRENRRLKDNFETLKLANDAQKKEFESLKTQHEKLEKQSLSVQARLTNLQRKQDFAQRQKDSECQIVPVSGPKQRPPTEGEEKDKPKSAKAPKPVNSNTYDVLSTLLDWVSDSHLRFSVTDTAALRPVDNRFMTPEFVQEKVVKILPSIVEMLKEYPGYNLKLCLPCLQFIYWSLVHVENGNQGQQKSNMTSTFRRLGEELYRSKSVRFTDSDVSSVTDVSTGRQDKGREGVYFRSANLHVRLLSSLIILRTLSQVDLLAHVFDVLKGDLKADTAKELFLYYQATPVVLQYLKPVNKPFMNAAMDTFLQMSADSPFLPPFLESCSTESWFRTVAMVLRSPRQDNKLLEKLSIILQKLSKIKGNKRFFEVYTISGIVQELLRSCSNEQAFLALNLKSILYNLNAVL